MVLITLNCWARHIEEPPLDKRLYNQEPELRFLEHLRLSGLPQGSVIGPLLFLLFVNDLPSVINVIALLFADDVKMVSPRSQSNFLQSSNYNVWNWSINWDLPINTTKCNYIAIGRAPPLTTGSCLYNVWNRSINWDLSNATIWLLGGLHHFNYPLPLEVQAIPYRSQTLIKTWAFSGTIPSHTPSFV